MTRFANWGVAALLFLTCAAPSTKPATHLAVPLHRAAWEQDVAAVNALLDRGADVTAKDENGRTALFLARSAAVVKRLLAAGLKVDDPDARGYSPLQWAVIGYFDAEVVAALIDARADVNRPLPLSEGRLIFGAAERNDATLAKMLLDAGADTSVTVRDMNALQWAQMHEAADVIPLLSKPPATTRPTTQP